jgi:hypothetical protein
VARLRKFAPQRREERKEEKKKEEKPVILQKTTFSLVFLSFFALFASSRCKVLHLATLSLGAREERSRPQPCLTAITAASVRVLTPSLA